MTFSELSRFLPMALLLMRLMVDAIFITSGWNHVTHAEERAKKRTAPEPVRFGGGVFRFG